VAEPHAPREGEGVKHIDNDETTSAELFKVYEEYNKTVRTWLVAYGIGAPVLLLNSDTLRGLVKTSGNGRRIALCFLGGVALQIVIAILNKTVMWTLFYGHLNALTDGFFHCVADWFSRQFWIDFIADIATCALFGYATWLIFKVVLP
jgi:hypothetical protein